MWSCDNAKNPKSDDFNFNFLKRLWDIMKMNIIFVVNNSKVEMVKVY